MFKYRRIEIVLDPRNISKRKNIKSDFVIVFWLLVLMEFYAAKRCYDSIAFWVTRECIWITFFQNQTKKKLLIMMICTYQTRNSLNVTARHIYDTALWYRIEKNILLWHLKVKLVTNLILAPEPFCKWWPSEETSRIWVNFLKLCAYEDI